MNNHQIKYAVPVSDRCSSGETEDKSGQVLRELVTKHLGASITSALVSDDVEKIEVDTTNVTLNVKIYHGY